MTSGVLLFEGPLLDFREFGLVPAVTFGIVAVLLLFGWKTYTEPGARES